METQTAFDYMVSFRTPDHTYEIVSHRFANTTMVILTHNGKLVNFFSIKPSIKPMEETSITQLLGIEDDRVIASLNMMKDEVGQQNTLISVCLPKEDTNLRQTLLSLKKILAEKPVPK